MIQQNATGADSTQTDGDGPDNSDKPPQPSRSASTKSNTPNAVKNPNPPSKTLSPITTNGHSGPPAVPLPERESNAYTKEPHIPDELKKATTASKLQKKDNNPPSPPSPDTNSISSGGDSWSPPSSHPPSRPSSRAPSMSTGKSGIFGLKSPKANEPPRTPVSAAGTPGPRKGTPSVHSDTGTGQKFTLKDLLANAPKLSRKSSQRSTASSKKSDSDAGAGSIAGASTVSLLKKYGVCEKIAIGKGATSVVRLVHKWDRTEEKIYAVKEFRKRRKNETEKEYVKKLTAEFCISSTLHHINIVETVDLVQDESLHWCEVMEFCPGGDLYGAIKKGGMSPSEVECCFKQILTGLTYLHSQGVAHRDIKPENIFFDTQGHLKIGDYGASTVYRLPWESTVHMSTGLCGSEPYIAPEQFIGKPYDARLVDIWACGIVYYCLHFQEMPWRAAQNSDALYASYAAACASSNSATSASPSTISNLSPRACRPLIRQMLEPNPKLRWTTEQIMAHPWIQSIDVCHAMIKPTHVHVSLTGNGAAS